MGGRWKAEEFYQAGYDDIIKIPHDALKKYLFVPCLVMTCAYGGGGGNVRMAGGNSSAACTVTPPPQGLTPPPQELTPPPQSCDMEHLPHKS